MLVLTVVRGWQDNAGFLNDNLQDYPITNTIRDSPIHSLVKFPIRSGMK